MECEDCGINLDCEPSVLFDNGDGSLSIICEECCQKRNEPDPFPERTQWELDWEKENNPYFGEKNHGRV